MKIAGRHNKDTTHTVTIGSHLEIDRHGDGCGLRGGAGVMNVDEHRMWMQRSAKGQLGDERRNAGSNTPDENLTCCFPALDQSKYLTNHHCKKTESASYLGPNVQHVQSRRNVVTELYT